LAQGPPPPIEAWRRYGNSPLQGRFLQNLVPILRRHLEGHLPAHAVPAQFVMLEALPRNPSGKVDRVRLPAPEKARPSIGVEFVPASSQVEKTLARIWSEVLGVSTVGVHDNFFELGGDSILGIQIVARAREAGVRLSPRDIFEHQTIQQLALVCPLTSAPVSADDAGLATSRSAGSGPAEGGVRSDGKFAHAGLSSEDLARLVQRIEGAHRGATA
jgi:aryl carrier-like protein